MGQPNQIGRYVVRGLLGEGGMGQVFQVWDPLMDRELALKLLARKSRWYGIPELRRRFTQEARSCGRLSHPAIVTIFDVGEDAAGDYLCMEWVRGENLAQRLSRGRVAVEQVLPLALHIAEALAHAHERGVIHRDIKPANVVVTPEGLLKVLDFGVAKNVFEARSTQQGVRMGTPGYMAPEYLFDDRLTSQSDQFSLGVLIFEALTGRRPYDAVNPMQLARQVAEPPPPLGVFCPEAPRPLVALVERLLARTPEERFIHTREIADALRDLGAGERAASRRPVVTDEALGQHLLSGGTVSVDALRLALAMGPEKNLLGALRSMRVLPDEKLLQAVAPLLRAEVFSQGARPLRPIATDLIPAAYQDSHGLVPLFHDLIRNELHVLVPAEHAPTLLPALERQLGSVQLKPLIAFRERVNRIRGQAQTMLTPTGGVMALPARKLLWVDARPHGQAAAQEMAAAVGLKVVVAGSLAYAVGLLAPGAFDAVVASGLPADELHSLKRHVDEHLPHAQFSVVALDEVVSGSLVTAQQAQELTVRTLVSLAQAMGADVHALVEVLATQGQRVSRVATQLRLSQAERWMSTQLVLAAAFDRCATVGGHSPGLLDAWSGAAGFEPAQALRTLLRRERPERIPRPAQIALVLELVSRGAAVQQRSGELAAVCRRLPAQLGLEPAYVEAALQAAGLAGDDADVSPPMGFIQAAL